MEAASFKKVLHRIIPFFIGLLNGYLFMVLLGIIASYTIFITIWLVNIYKEQNLSWLYPFTDVALNIIQLTFALFLVLSITKFLYYKTVRENGKRTIITSTIGLLVLPFLFYILPTIFSTFRHYGLSHNLIIALSFIVIPIFINSYILKRFFKQKM